MKDVKCECGHVNPHGTVLCEACGKVLDEQSQDKPLLDMRYEGSARRSQTYNKTIVDKIWNFFSSVKVGVWLIVITLVASAARNDSSARNVHTSYAACRRILRRRVWFVWKTIL